MQDHIKCPKCGDEANDLFCLRCQKQFVKKENIIYFAEDLDEYYEGKFVENKDAKGMLPGFLPEKIKFLIWKFFVNYSLILYYQKFFVRYLSILKKEKERLKILDLACGGGNSFLKEFGEVHGVDISRKSIEVAKNNYDICYVADIYNLPFADKSFDVVTSFELVEHIPHDKFGIFLQEINRVLKDDGISLHYYVVDSQCLLGRFIKRYPDLFKKYFVEKDGHYGLRKACESKMLFGSVFNVVEFKTIFSRLLMPLGMVNYFRNEYKEKNFLIKTSVYLSEFIISNIYLHSLSSILLAPVYSISDYFKEEDEGFNALVCLKKKSEKDE